MFEAEKRIIGEKTVTVLRFVSMLYILRVKGTFTVITA